MTKSIQIALVAFSVAMLAVPMYSWAAEITRARIEFCKGDYFRLCSQYTAYTDIKKCFHNNWAQVSEQCKRAK